MSYPLTSAQLEYHDPPRVKVRHIPPARGVLEDHLLVASRGPQWLIVCTACNDAWTEHGALPTVHDNAHRHSVIYHQEAPC